MQQNKTLTVKELVEITGKKKSTIYNLAKQLGRLPTVEEVNAVKIGRPKKYYETQENCCNELVVFPAIIQKDEKDYMVSFPDLEGCFSSGRTILEAFVNARDALKLFLSDLTEIPKATDIEFLQVEADAYVMLITTEK